MISLSKKVKKNTPLIPPPPAINNVSRKLNLKIKTAVGIPAKPGLSAQDKKTAKAAEKVTVCIYNFCPNAKSPASPRPGMIYEWELSSSSTTPNHSV